MPGNEVHWTTEGFRNGDAREPKRGPSLIGILFGGRRNIENPNRLLRKARHQALCEGFRSPTSSSESTDPVCSNTTSIVVRVMVMRRPANPEVFVAERDFLTFKPYTGARRHFRPYQSVLWVSVMEATTDLQNTIPSPLRRAPPRQARAVRSRAGRRATARTCGSVCSSWASRFSSCASR